MLVLCWFKNFTNKKHQKIWIKRKKVVTLHRKRDMI